MADNIDPEYERIREIADWNTTKEYTARRTRSLADILHTRKHAAFMICRETDKQTIDRLKAIIHECDLRIKEVFKLT